ncbi:MAG: ribonuclease J [Sulfurimonas sp. RIFCSPLOWO2_12_FULL_36_74]|uniref:ribonuclease J n=1 Tax=Sulfurimonas sp. RIFCSPLOWO2_12_36_12 TaxID=1802253 RepID=UPI0008C03B25|nr:ribonuclease J [Sulfurimonas sp. RIFCSPLOWO2_12_36_12]OHD97799.1 MAG: ribonuclease J [Sulfurimonas sp. RIFCSPLOWO2_02_FULL_36_28]OHE00629.1 MAG: ribonuclease J [Sulfurimonas sp. RIFCSPLOWO2_12_36_12]OHE06586.1 MAG: ribonuclease J [Sulfurimonas sp. RIFCSPLOWO2_12_FULL_36_74]
MEQENQEINESISQENRKPNNYNNRRPNNNNSSKPNNQNGNKPAGSNPAGSNPANSSKNKSASRGRRRQSTPVDENLKAFVEINQEAHKQRLNPHYKLDLNSKEKIRITPLGGLGEIGGNITVFETQNEAILVDVGMSFPDEDMHGVDILVPDFTYIREIKDKIKAIIITHAHEDHIGAMPYLYKEMQFPIYGSPLPLAMIGSKFDEHHIKEFKQHLHPIEKRKIYKIGEDFEIEWMHMTHSIIDSSSLAITTPAGTIIHTGDFKIDHTPVDGYTADLHRLAHYGDKGVLCLLSDSTNSYNTAPTPSELSVAPALDRVFSKAEGRVLLSTFSSNIHRVFQAIQYGVKYGRKVCVIGRSMERNIEIAMQYDYIKLPKNIFVEPEQIASMNDKDILIVTTGSQGEPSSALFRMSIGEHRHVKIKPNDLIVLSSRPIPGNEGSISGMLNHLQRAGAKIALDRELHVSGHASIEEQKLMLRLVNPKFFLPIHGEYNHVMKHKETAMMCGVPERNIYIMNDGDTVEIAPKYMRKVKTVRTGKTYIDNQNNHKIEDDIVIDRQKLASDGIVMIVAQIDGQHSTMLSKPLVTSFGLVSDKQDKFFAKEIEEVLEHFLANIKEGLIENARALENDLRQVVRKHIYRKMKKYPLIVPHIFVM